MKLSAYGKTHTGLMRSNNEDSFFVDEKLGLFIVADGMGGHAAGEVASNMAIEVVREKLEPLLNGRQSIEKCSQALADAVSHANQTIMQAAAENSHWSGMGTTLTILLLHSGQALLAHVGDSRLYRWRDATLQQLSDDHSLIAEQLRRGIIDQQDAETSNLRNVLLQAVGISEELDIFQKVLPSEPGDTFLLCSDGLTGMLTDNQISTILGNNDLPQQSCEQLIAAALVAGGKDNVTAVLVTAK